VVNQRIADWLYGLVAQDAHFQCGYCRCPQQVLPYRLEIEHLLPTSLGGQDDRENLWLSCHRCNKLRSNLMQVTDPLTGVHVPIFNPRRDRWADHFVWEQDGLLIVGLTDRGRGTAAVLNLNDRYHLSARGVWIMARAYPPV
jgi:hypothetical protein